MTKLFLERLAGLNRASYVDVSRGMVAPERAAKRERDCTEDRTNAHVMRENGMTTEEILDRFGYVPSPLPEAKPTGPFRRIEQPSGVNTAERTVTLGYKRGSMEPG